MHYFPFARRAGALVRTKPGSTAATSLAARAALFVCLLTFPAFAADGDKPLSPVEARKQIGKEITVKMEARRAGDPSRLVADARKAREVLGWNPKYPDLETIVRTAWKWHEARPSGYTPSHTT